MIRKKPERADVLYVADLGRKLGRTESGIRMAVHRRSDSIPPHFMLAGRIAWNREDVDAWLRRKARAAS